MKTFFASNTTELNSMYERYLMDYVSASLSNGSDDLASQAKADFQAVSMQNWSRFPNEVGQWNTTFRERFGSLSRAAGLPSSDNIR